MNILITIFTSLVIYKLSISLGLKERGAVISSVSFLTFSSIFYYADKIILDLLQTLTFSIVILYYLKLRNEKTILLKNILILSIFLAIAFLTKFYSFFLPIIILTDSFLHNRKSFKYFLLSIIISIILISPYLYFYVKLNIHRLALQLSAIQFKSNLVYFDIFWNFGIFLGPYVAVAIVWFIWKSSKNALILSWLFLPLAVFIYLQNKDPRFAFILMPLYAVSCGSFFERMEKIKFLNGKLSLVWFVTGLLILQFIYNIYLNSQEFPYPIDRLTYEMKKNGNVLILSETPVHSAVYMLYENFGNFSGNTFRPCILEENNLTKEFLKSWGVMYIIDQNNTIDKSYESMLNIELIKEEKINNLSFKLFENNGVVDKVDCNFICLLNGVVCKNESFSKLTSLIRNKTYGE